MIGNRISQRVSINGKIINGCSDPYNRTTIHKNIKFVEKQYFMPIKSMFSDKGRRVLVSTIRHCRENVANTDSEFKSKPKDFYNMNNQNLIEFGQLHQYKHFYRAKDVKDLRKSSTTSKNIEIDKNCGKKLSIFTNTCFTDNK